MDVRPLCLTLFEAYYYCLQFERGASLLDKTTSYVTDIKNNAFLLLQIEVYFTSSLLSCMSMLSAFAFYNTRWITKATHVHDHIDGD